MNLNFVKDVHMICANFITNIIIVAEGEEKKRGGDITFIPPLVHISYCIHHLIHSHKASNKYKSYGLVKQNTMIMWSSFEIAARKNNVTQYNSRTKSYESQ